MELTLGKTVFTEVANTHFFGGKIKSVTIGGWGYSYDILRKIGPMAGTLMAPTPAAAQVEKFSAVDEG